MEQEPGQLALAAQCLSIWKERILSFACVALCRMDSKPVFPAICWHATAQVFSPACLCLALSELALAHHGPTFACICASMPALPLKHYSCLGRAGPASCPGMGEVLHAPCLACRVICAGTPCLQLGCIAHDCTQQLKVQVTCCCKMCSMQARGEQPTTEKCQHLQSKRVINSY